MGKVSIKNGNVFQGACDLIILPCSTVGTVTSFVFKSLKTYSIPSPAKDLKLGEIQLLPFKGGENIAQYVAFAASVHKNSSNLQAIQNIGKEIAGVTVKYPAIKIIHSSLLGTGAGNLAPEKVVEELKKGFESISSVDATLIIHVIQLEIFTKICNYFNKLLKTNNLGELGQPSRIRVFISWTNSNDNQANWVKEVATFLRENGIDVRIDIWHLRVGMDLPQFMTNEISMADKVLIISNEQYAERADGRIGGVGWETMIIQGYMMTYPSENSKFLTIVKCDNIERGLPSYLRTKFHIIWRSDSNEGVKRQEVLKELQNERTIPSIGVSPFYL